MPAPDRLDIAGYDAAWTRIDLDVRDESSQPIAAEPVEVYALADAGKSIDAAALLREPVIPDPPYWALPWTGARAIAAIVSSTMHPATGRILDLGCGLGLAGLAVSRRGSTVTFGDYLEEPLEFVRASLERSGASGCEVRRIDFTREDDHGLFELILAADIVYDPAHYAPLARFLDRSLAPGGTILLTESLRADAGVFLEGLLAHGFVDDKRALWVMEDGRRERTWLHTLKRTG